MNEGKKFDQGKPRYDLMPFRALDEIAQVLGHGARKYGDDNWRLVADGRRRYIAATLRHISAYQQGEQNDPESTLHHLSHAACSLLFILALELEQQDAGPMDDAVLDAMRYGLGMARMNGEPPFAAQHIPTSQIWRKRQIREGK